MSAEIWEQVDRYIGEKLGSDDEVLKAVLAASEAAGLPDYQVSPAQARLLALLVRMTRSRHILEIGTLGGYSAIHMARAAGPEGEVITLEYDPHHATIARENLARAGLTAQVEVRVGAAAAALPLIEQELRPKFDFVFIDADKPNNRVYLEWALKLGRPGAVVVCDNVIRDGRVIDGQSGDANVQGARDAFDFIGTLGTADATAIQTLGVKGYDGFAIFIVPETAT